MPTVVSKKRSKENITLGSAHVYLSAYTEEVGIPKTLAGLNSFCNSTNLMGHIKGGASLEYTQETTEESDDFGTVRKVITTKENAVVKFGLITWNTETLKNLIDRCTVTEETETVQGAEKKYRLAKIGGVGNAQGGYYVLVLKHEDKTDGNVYVVIVGRNTAGASLKFANDAGTQVEPEFTAIPSDEDGTLIYMIEDLGAAA